MLMETRTPTEGTSTMATTRKTRNGNILHIEDDGFRWIEPAGAFDPDAANCEICGDAHLTDTTN